MRSNSPKHSECHAQPYTDGVSGASEARVKYDKCHPTWNVVEIQSLLVRFKDDGQNRLLYRLVDGLIDEKING